MSSMTVDRNMRFASVRSWLHEPPGELFHRGKWLFWLPALVVLSALNTILTVQTFGTTGQVYWFIGLMLFWLSIGALHYSDVPSRFLAVLISIMDGVILVSLAFSFCLLFYIQGQASILRGEESKFEQTKQQDNATALQALAETRRIAEANARAEQARSTSISAYQENGQMLSASRLARGGAMNIKVPEVKFDQREYTGESSSAFLLSWLKTVRTLTSFEVFMTIFTLFVIRIGTAWINQKNRPKNRPASPPFPSGSHDVQAGDVQAVSRRTQHSLPAAVEPSNVSAQDIASLGHSHGQLQAAPQAIALGHIGDRLGQRTRVQKIKFDLVAPGVWASRDKRTKDRYNVNRTRNGLGTKYLCRISTAELERLKSSPPQWGREFIYQKIISERRNDAKKQQAIEFLEAA